MSGGVHLTDVTNAARTMLMDLATAQWHAPTAEALRIPLELLPRIVSNAQVYGTVVRGVAPALPSNQLCRSRSTFITVLAKGVGPFEAQLQYRAVWRSKATPVVPLVVRSQRHLHRASNCPSLGLGRVTLGFSTAGGAEWSAAGAPAPPQAASS